MSVTQIPGQPSWRRATPWIDNVATRHYLKRTVRRLHMARLSTYLSFMGKPEEAFSFYRVVFGTELAMPIQRMSDAPAGPGAPQLSDAEKKMAMHMVSCTAEKQS